MHFPQNTTFLKVFWNILTAASEHQSLLMMNMKSCRLLELSGSNLHRSSELSGNEIRSDQTKLAKSGDKKLESGRKIFNLKIFYINNI